MYLRFDKPSSHGLKLPIHFDPERLRLDVALIEPEEWSPHYNEQDFGGQWRAVSLRSANGSPLNIQAGSAGAAPFTDTALLQRCGYFRDVLSHFHCPLKSVRLLSLEPGSFIREHCDPALEFDEGEVRIHIPLQTNPRVEFYVCGERLQFEEGACYYINVNLPHRVNNRGSAPRVHLVIDAIVNDWLRTFFAQGEAIPRSALAPAAFEGFARAVFSDKSLQEKLRAMADRARLLKAAADEAGERGFDLNEADIEAGFRAGPVAASSEGWIPARVETRDSQPWVTWISDPAQRFTEPFFADSISRSMRNPFTGLFRCKMPLGGLPRVRPDGFIFHMSRCGSTLISRSLAAVDRMLVISEAPPLDTIVQTGRTDWVEQIVSALGRSRSDVPERYLIKLDAWHIRSLPIFRSAFPDVPWIFVHRDPADVLMSWLTRPGLQASPGAMDPSILGMRLEDITGLTRQQWCARVIQGFMASALEYRDDPNGMFVDYGELPGAICGRIAKHFGLGLSEEEEAKIVYSTHFDSKSPGMEFSSDRDEKRKRIENLPTEAGLDELRALYQAFDRRSS